MDRIFEALASAPRRKILKYLAVNSMTAGELADRFDISKPSLSKHLSILENAGLVTSEKKGQFVHYKFVDKNLRKTLDGFISEIFPVTENNTLKDSLKVEPIKTGTVNTVSKIEKETMKAEEDKAVESVKQSLQKPVKIKPKKQLQPEKQQKLF